MARRVLCETHRILQTKAPEPRAADGALEMGLFASLAELHQKGILSTEESTAKKALSSESSISQLYTCRGSYQD
jgi:hypothetical protein